MFKIVVFEDSIMDFEAIRDILLSSKLSGEIELIHYLSLKKGIEHLRFDKPDLLLLDLEFTLSNVSSISYMHEIPREIPILVVSHLAHYRKPLEEKLRIKGFITKSNMKLHLAPAVFHILHPEELSDVEPSKVIFPSGSPKVLSQAIAVKQIRFIDFYSKNKYIVSLTDGSTREIHSVSFRAFCSSLDNSGITTLRPINKNQIVNMNCLSSVKKMSNNRIELTLINLPGVTFKVGDRFEKHFRDLLE